MPTDSFTDALERLDPASRALLDLSLRRGMRTEEIAEVLGADPDSVAASRDEALRRVAEDVGMPGHHQVDEVRARLAELPADDWLGRAATNGTATAASAEARVETAPVEPLPAPVALLQPATEQAEGGGQKAEGMAEPEEAEAEAEAEAAEPQETATSAEPRERRRVLPVLLGLLVVAGVIVAVVLGSGGDDGKKASNTPSAPAPASKPKPAKPKPASPGPGAKVAAFGTAANVSGTARIAGDHLVLDVNGLPAPRGGYYEVWLYNSLIDARSLARSQSGHIKLDAKLPGDWKRYRFVDVSREPNDGNVSPSGESVARVPVSRLAR